LSDKITEQARGLVLPIAQRMGFDVVDAAFTKDGADWYLRVYIDKRGGITIDDCERLSKEYSLVLDKEDIIDRAYMLEVSSPGLDRPLTTEADFRRYAGERLDIQMLPGKAKTGIRSETPNSEKSGESDKSGETGKSGESGKTSKSGKTGKARGSALRQVAGKPDLVTGVLDRLENGRVYLSDNRGDIFSVAREDVKTVKRTISF